LPEHVEVVLLDRDVNTPMLVINGADDVHVVCADTLLFSGRRHTDVQHIPGTRRCRGVQAAGGRPGDCRMYESDSNQVSM
jgi:esterase FrsA